MSKPRVVTIFGQIARHVEKPFWGLITITDGFITKIERGTVFADDYMTGRGAAFVADYTFGPECLIFAGFGDVHIHAREDETGLQCYKEDYTTAGNAALNGGVVHACCMPNTPNPVTTLERFRWHRSHIRENAHPVLLLNYIGIDATTRPIEGIGATPFKVYFGKSVGTLSVILAGDLDTILARYRGRHISFHVEYEPIVLNSTGGKTHSDRRPVACVNEGLRLLLPLIEKHGIKAKLCHWSTGGESFQLIEEYRARGCHIELEVSPLHLYFDTSMTDEDPSLWLRAQMNPAIQGPEHRMALINGLRSGFIQYLATDHAPHTEEEKYSAFAAFREQFPGKTNKDIAARIRTNSPEFFAEVCTRNNHSGAPWLDTYALICAWLMREHGFSPQDIARVAAYNPGRFVHRFLAAQYPGRDFGKGFGDIAEGFVGSLTVLNTARTTMVDRANLKTKVGWSPLEGYALPGAVEAVFIEGVKH